MTGTSMQRRQALAGAASLFGLAMAPPKALASVPLPSKDLLSTAPEKYWKQIREEQFYLPDWRVFLNNGSLGVMPKPVCERVADYLQTGASLVTDVYPRWGYELLEEHRTLLGDFIGASKDEVAITHSATTSMSIVAAGLDLKAGDEVLITDQEHPSGRGCWYMKAARSGITVREVKIPQTPKSQAEVADIVVSAIGPRTKVLSFSGVTTTTGLIMPAKEICAGARAKGVATVVDGAHMHGQIPVNARDIGCDFMAGSPHKWLFAPPGSGLLYIRDEWIDGVWPTVVTGNWDDKKLRAAKFMMLGTNNRAVVEGMVAGLAFHKAIGGETIRGRMKQLSNMCIAKAKSMPEFMDLVTPEDPSMYSALVTVRFKKDSTKLRALARKKRIWLLGADPLRIAMHIHTRPSDLDIFFETVREAFG